MIDLDNIESIWSKKKSLIEETSINFEAAKTQKTNESKLKLKSYFWLNLFSLITSVIFSIYTISFAVEYYVNTPLFLSATIISVWLVYLMLGAIIQIKKQFSLDYSKGVIEVQQDLISLHLSAVKLLRRSLLIIPFYFSFMLVLAKSVFGVELYAIADASWLLFNLLLTMFFVVITFYLYRRLQPKYIDSTLVKTLINGSGSQALEAAKNFNDIQNLHKN